MDGLLAVHAVDDPAGFTPHAVGLLLVADALIDAVTAEDEEVAEHDVAGLVDAPGEEHAAGVVGREDGELAGQDLGDRGGLGGLVTVERDPEQAGSGGDLVDGGEVRAEQVRIHNGAKR